MRFRRFLSDGSRVRASIMLSLGIVWLMKAAMSVSESDFLQFYIAARRFWADLHPYQASVMPSGFPFGFPYPPLAIFLVSPVAAFSVDIGLRLWELITLEAYAVTVYLLAKLWWNRALPFATYAHIFVGSITAASLVGFAWHNLNLIILLCATVSLFLILRRGQSFLPGVLLGMMSIKPHMVLFVGPLLLWRAPSKGRFLAGSMLVIAISLVPFLNTCRPVSDLHAMVSAVRGYGAQAYYLDEQSVGAALFRIFRARPEAPQLFQEHSAPGRVVEATFVRRLNTWKAVGLVLAAFVGWLGWRRGLWRRDEDAFAAAFALNLAGAFYSHASDAVFLLPLVVCAFCHSARRVSSAQAAAVFIAVNLFIWQLLPLGSSTTNLNWERISCLSIFHLTLLVSLLWTLKSKKASI